MKIPGNDYSIISKRTKIMMKTLANAERPLKINELAERTQTSERTVYYDLDYVNYFLQRNGLNRIEPVNSMYSLTVEQREILIKAVNESVRIGEKDNRTAYLICSLLYPSGKVTVDKLSIELDTSRNTILNDIQDIKKILQEAGCQLAYNKKDGYQILSDVYTRRYLFIRYLSSFIRSSNYRFLNLFDEEKVERYIEGITRIFELLSVNLKRRDIVLMSYMLILVGQEKTDRAELEKEANKLKDTREYEITETCFHDLSEDEKLALTFLVIAHTRSQTFHSDDEDEIYHYAQKLVGRYEELNGIRMSDYDTLIYRLYRELLMIRQGYLMKVPVPFVFDVEVRKAREEIYNTIEQIVNEKVDQIACPIWSEEISRLTLLFIAHMPYEVKKKKVRCIILCNNVSDLQNFLIHEISRISEDLEIVRITDDLRQAKQIPCDLLLTVPRINDFHAPVIQISSIITDIDLKRIEDWLISHPE